jgi:hypothetical protein
MKQPVSCRTLSSGKLQPELVTTRTAAWSDAPEALLDPSTKVVLVRDPITTRQSDYI